MRSYRTALLVALMLVGILGRVSAQVRSVFDPGPQPTDMNSNGDDGNPSSNNEDASFPPDNKFTVWPVLIVPGVADLAGLSGTGVLIGAGLSSGYGKVESTSRADTSGFISVAQPYVALFQSGHRHKILAEYSPTIDLYNNGQPDARVLQSGGIRAFSDLSPKWRIFFSDYTTYGKEYLRELYSVGTGYFPGYLTFEFPTDTVFLTEGKFGFNWKFSRRHELTTYVGNVYRNVEHVRHDDAAEVRTQLNNSFRRGSYWYVYAQTNHYSYQAGCTRTGAGQGLVLDLNSTTLGFEAGPEYGGHPCTDRLSAAFNAWLAQKLTPSTAFYLSAYRDLLEPYLLENRWTDVFSAKLLREISRHTSVAAGAAYLNSRDTSNQLYSRYHSFLLFSEFNWRLSNSVNFVTTYRYFKRGSFEGQQPFHDRHSWMFCSIVFQPTSRGARRSY
jgi:hypothetical protein